MHDCFTWRRHHNQTICKFAGASNRSIDAYSVLLYIFNRRFIIFLNTYLGTSIIVLYLPIVPTYIYVYNNNYIILQLTWLTTLFTCRHRRVSARNQLVSFAGQLRQHVGKLQVSVSKALQAWQHRYSLRGPEAITIKKSPERVLRTRLQPECSR